MSVPPFSVEEVAAVRAQHGPCDCHARHEGGPLCRECGGSWPCDLARVCASLDRALSEAGR